MTFKDRWHREKALKAARKAARRRAGTPVVGVGWYSREQWEALTEVVPDRSALDDTYEAWEAQATEALLMLAAQDVRPIKVEVNVEELVEWCRSEGEPVNGESRASFVSHLLAKRSGSTEAPWS